MNRNKRYAPAEVEQENEVFLCRSCRIQALMDRGVHVTGGDLNHWSMYGCTCDPEDAQDAQDFFDLITQ